MRPHRQDRFRLPQEVPSDGATSRPVRSQVQGSVHRLRDEQPPSSRPSADDAEALPHSGREGLNSGSPVPFALSAIQWLRPLRSYRVSDGVNTEENNEASDADGFETEPVVIGSLGPVRSS